MLEAGLGYDWAKSYTTPEAIEKDLSGFKFKGSGWYMTDTDTVLVEKSPIKGGLMGFRVTVWNMPTGRDVLFQWMLEIMSTPIVSDERHMKMSTVQKM